MYKVNNKDTRITLVANLTPCSSISIINFDNFGKYQLGKRWLKIVGLNMVKKWVWQSGDGTLTLTVSEE